MHGSVERTTLEGVELRSRRAGVRRARSTDTDDYTWSVEYYRDQLQRLDNATLPPDILTAPGSHQALAHTGHQGQIDDVLTSPSVMTR